MRTPRIARADRLALVETVTVVVAAPFLLFPGFSPGITAGACVALVLVWLVRWFVTRRPGTPTALDVPLLLLLLTVPVAVWASAIPELTLPKLSGLILGFAAFRATVNTVRTPRHLQVAVIMFLLLGLWLVAAGMVSTAWLNKWAALQPILVRIPRLIQGLPGAAAGVHPNELAGTLLLFLPISVAALCMDRGGRGWVQWVVTLANLLLILFFGAVLLLTQSRSAWIGAVAGWAVMVWVRWRPARWVILAAALILACGLLSVGPQDALASLFPGSASGSVGSLASTVALEGRLELWNRALYGIEDFAFTGTGLGTFREVVHLLYPLFLMSPEADIAHVHNVFLQVALDVGLPGLVAYLALVGTAVWIGLRLAPPARGDDGSAGSPHRWLALGILGSLVAFHVYGLTDTVALGAKPGVAFWVLLALAAALWNTAPRSAQPEDDSPEAPGAQSV